MALYPEIHGDAFQGNGTNTLNPQFPEAEWKKQLDTLKQEKKIQQAKAQGAAEPASSMSGIPQTSPRPALRRGEPAAETRTPTATKTAGPTSQFGSNTAGTSLPVDQLNRNRNNVVSSGPETGDQAQTQEIAQPESLQVEPGLAPSQAKPEKAAPAADAVGNLAVKKLGTSTVLKSMWLGLVPSYGLSFIYIEFHFIAAYLFRSRLFCRFGEEWVPVKNPLATGSKAAEIVELLVFFLINALLAVAVFILIGTIVMMVIIIQKALEAIPGV